MRIVSPSFEILAIPNGEESLALLERIGRTAYKSEDKIDPGEAGYDSDGKMYWIREPSSHRFIRMILKHSLKEKLRAGVRDILYRSESDPSKEVVEFIIAELQDNPPHESVIEHCGATVLFVSNRGFTHELVRHRLCAFTQSSTRYCNYSKEKFGEEISVTKRVELQGEEVVEELDRWLQSLREAEAQYMYLTKHGIPAQIARDVLPQALIADIVCTTNFREWRHIFRMRCSKAAHPDMRLLMKGVLKEFKRRIPIIFDDIGGLS